MSATNSTVCRCRSRGCVTRVPTLLVVAAATAACLMGSRAAWAQLDTRGLIGYAVTEIGPKTQDVDQAITRFKNGDIDGARQLLVRAKKKNPELPPPEVLLAKLYFTTKQVTSCRAALERAIRDNPNDPEAYVFSADLANAEGALTAAGMLYSRAVKANQSLADGVKRKRNYESRTLSGLATVAERREDWRAAQEHLTALVKIQPDNSSAWERLGRALFMQNDQARAEKAFDKARQADPSRPHPAVLMARLYQEQGKPAEARRYFEQALAADSKTAATRVAYARWLLDRGEPAKARAQIDAALKQTPTDRSALVLGGLAAVMEKNYTAAENYLKQAHLLAPTNIDVLSYLAMALAEQKDEKKRQLAAAFATLGARQDPQNGNARATLGWILYRLGRGREAEQSLNAALKTRTLSADSRYLVGQIFFERGQNAPASQLLASALKMRGFFLHRREAQALLDKIKK